jgi:hypothetical protein
MHTSRTAVLLLTLLSLFAVTGQALGQNCTPPATPPVTCTIWNSSMVPGSVDPGDASSGEYGFKFRADMDGTLVGVRFYKSAANTGTHTINLWTSAGSLLASAVVSGETPSGWQQFNFSAPVPITAGTTYVASYFAPNGHYSFDRNYFDGSTDAAPLHAIANSVSVNGVYNYSPTSTFPTSTFAASNYWIDVVFAPNTSTPPTVLSTSPANGASLVSMGASLTVTFSEPMDATTLNSSNVLLVDSLNNPAPGTVTYNNATSVLTYKPSVQLNPLTTYTATVKGSVKDTYGNAMGNDVSWSFMTGQAPSNSGPGGPVLVISSAANPFSRYYGEILSAEGLNYYTVQDVSSVTPSTLAGYDLVILGDMSLTTAQVSMLTNWVGEGGNLIAMHPDKQLATLLGLTSTSQTLSDAYLLVNTAVAPGTGIVNQTMQYHGLADLYSLNGASRIATLYSNATTATTAPAVTLFRSGAGQAAAFTYDLARSVVYTRQGNPAWSGQSRDGYVDPDINRVVIRSDDLFFGNASFDPQPDWIDFNKVAIPQADEQQRLLANLIELMNAQKKPLPRFWYFPSGFKAVVIMTGDDHARGGTQGRFEDYINYSTADCSVADWQCVRSTSYVYPNTPIDYIDYFLSLGFEIALHVDTVPSCTDWTPSGLESDYTSQLALFASNYPLVPPSQTNRTHCVLWSDYDSQPQIELNHGIRLDTTYYYWPTSWMQNQPGLFTGSGMPMRFADRNGNIIDVYQATTQIPDEDNWTYPGVINTLLDNAIGSLGYYGAFTANMHTDWPASAGSDAIVASAQARGVPIVSAAQMLAWLDGRNSSAFSSMNWNNTALSFTITAGSGARNLQAMLPMNSPSGALSSLLLGGQTVSYNTQTIKGIQYAFFTATPGSYTATYGGAPVTYSLTGTISGSGGNGATVTLSGASTASVTANASGGYTFTGLANGAYTVTPSKAGFVFSPSSRNVTVSGANITGVNFTSTVQTFSISGTISGSGGNAATVTLSGAGSGSTTSNSTGSFTFTGRANGTYTVTPTKAGFAYTPASQTVTVNGADVTGVNFSSTAVAPVVQLSPTSLSFGSLAVGSSSASQAVTLKNIGTASLSLTSITFAGTNPGDFAQTNNCSSSLAVNASCTVNVTFKPTATGTRSGSLRFTDNASGSPQSVSLTGTGTGPMASLSVTSITFPVIVNFTTSAAQTVTLRNTGTSTLNISSIAVTGTNAADFAISSQTCGTTLTAGSTCTVSVTFRPQASGARSASLAFSDNAFGSPQTVALGGTGTMVTVGPTTLTFSLQAVGTTSAAKTVTLTNAGPSSLSISSISFTGTNATDFSQTNTCGSSLASGGNCTISVEFTPRGRGARRATLRIADSDPTSPQQITLSGSGL